MPEYPLIFIHLPKTAGTSLRKTIQINYRPGELFFMYGKNPDFHSMKELKQLDQNRFAQYKIIMGHFPFSKKLFPFEDRRFVTILRDPVRRVISYYRHVMSRDEWKGREISLQEYIESSGDIQLRNHQTRLLSGMKRDPITEKHLEKAIRNLEKYFLHVGTSETFPQTIDRLHELLGWSKKKLFHENVTTNKQATTDYFSEDVLDRLREQNEYDIKLHECVTSRLAQNGEWRRPG